MKYTSWQVMKGFKMGKSRSRKKSCIAKVHYLRKQAELAWCILIWAPLPAISLPQVMHFFFLHLSRSGKSILTSAKSFAYSGSFLWCLLTWPSTLSFFLCLKVTRQVNLGQATSFLPLGLVGKSGNGLSLSLSEISLGSFGLLGPETAWSLELST